jgi:hypothetical protein
MEIYMNDKNVLGKTGLIEKSGWEKEGWEKTKFGGVILDIGGGGTDGITMLPTHH